MNIKELSDFRKKSIAGETELTETTDALRALSSHCDQAQKVVLESISEKDFVGLCRTVKDVLLSMTLADGSGKALMLAEMAGELDGLLDTYFLTVLGLLMQEEVV